MNQPMEQRAQARSVIAESPGAGRGILRIVLIVSVVLLLVAGAFFAFLMLLFQAMPRG